MDSNQFLIGDNVRVLRSDITEALGLAGRVGVCHGFTTPSATGVEVVGGATEDIAFALHFEDDGMDEVWFSPALLEFADHAPGLRATVGDQEFVKAEDGSWVPVEGSPTRTRRWFRRRAD